MVVVARPGEFNGLAAAPVAGGAIDSVLHSGGVKKIWTGICALDAAAVARFELLVVGGWKRQPVVGVCWREELQKEDEEEV